MNAAKVFPLYLRCLNTPVGINMFTIETATIRDLISLRKLEQECFVLDAWPLLDLAGVLTFPGIIRLKAVDNGALIGFIAADASSSSGIGWITTVGVLINHRRQGVGKALLEACEIKMSAPEIRLTVRKSNIGAIQMYLENGYIQTETWHDYYKGGEDGVVMRKLRAV
jgi:ribosomal protein S18 acetylase RimI-like enzyme